MSSINVNENLYFNLDRAALLLRRYVYDVLSEHDLSPEQWEIFQYIDLHAGVTQRELTDRTMRNKGNLSRTLARMEKQGWILKSIHSENKRGYKITLTASGKLLKKHMPELIEKQMLKVLAGLDKGDKSSLIEVLGSLRSVLGDDYSEG